MAPKTPENDSSPLGTRESVFQWLKDGISIRQSSVLHLQYLKALRNITLRLQIIKPKSFDKAIAELCEKYQFVTKYLGLSEQTLVFSRLHVSDIINQKNLLAKSELFRHIGHGVVSVIQQTPLTPDSLVLFSYHLKKENREVSKGVSGQRKRTVAHRNGR